MNMAATTTRLGVDHPTVVPRSPRYGQDEADARDESTANNDGASA